jgi:hypothetical protein
MKHIAQKVITWSILLALVCQLSATAFAVSVTGNALPVVTVQESEEDAAEDADDVLQNADLEQALAEIMASNPEDAELPNTVQPVTPEASYNKKFTYSDGFSMSGIFESETMYFKVQNYWDTVYAYAAIEFSLSQLISDVPASMTFMVNDVPIYSCKMDYQYGKDQIVYVTIPVQYLNEGYNSFTITGYVRIYDDEGCLDDLSGANWVYIQDSSFVEVGYELLDHQQKISYYPYPFISTVEESGAYTQILVSDAAGNEELEAALLLRADLASETDSEDAITLTRYSARSKNGTKNTILVSTLANLPAECEQWLSKEEQAAILPNTAQVRFVLDNNGNPLLLVVAEDADDLMEAAQMLVDDSRVVQEKTSTAVVLSGSAQRYLEANEGSDMAADRYTIESLTGGGITFTGPFHQTADIFLPFSGGYVLSGSSKVSLNFRYSKNLDFTRSMITVYWGDVPVASKKLTEENANGDELSFLMPTDVIGTYASKITIAFDLELPDLFCTPRMDEMPWAYVSASSSLYLPMGSSSTLSFSLRPYPFESSSQFNDLLVVIPDSPTDEELDTLGRVIAIYGESIEPYGTISVCRASEFDSTDARRPIITIGTYADNSLIRELNDSLSFAYTEDGTRFASNAKLILSESYAANIGVMQLINSPYADDEGILVVSAANDSALQTLNTYLRKSKNVWKLADDAVIVDEDNEISTFAFLSEVASSERPSLKEFVEENRSSILFTVVATSAMLLLLLAILLILIRGYARGQGRNSEKEKNKQ